MSNKMYKEEYKNFCCSTLEFIYVFFEAVENLKNRNTSGNRFYEWETNKTVSEIDCLLVDFFLFSVFYKRYILGGGFKYLGHWLAQQKIFQRRNIHTRYKCQDYKRNSSEILRKEIESIRRKYIINSLLEYKIKKPLKFFEEKNYSYQDHDYDIYTLNRNFFELQEKLLFLLKEDILKEILKSIENYWDKRIKKVLSSENLSLKVLVENSKLIRYIELFPGCKIPYIEYASFGNSIEYPELPKELVDLVEKLVNLGLATYLGSECLLEEEESIYNDRGTHVERYKRSYYPIVLNCYVLPFGIIKK